MANEQMIIDFLVGKDSITPTLKTLEKWSREVEGGIQDLTRKAIVPYTSSSKEMTKATNRDIAAFQKLNSIMSPLTGKIANLRKQTSGSGAGVAGGAGGGFAGMPRTFDLDDLDQMANKIRQLGRMGAQGFNISGLTQGMRDLAKEAGITTKQFDMFFKEGSRKANQFDARLLSLLFTGMALSRTFSGALRGITNSFMKSEDETSGLSQATTRLSASWEFFKFSLMDALNTPFFIGIIDGITNLVNWFGNLDPAARLAILGVIGSLALLGKGALIYAQIRLAYGATFGAGGLLAKQAAETAASVTTVGTAGTGVASTLNALTFAKFLGVAALVVGAALLIKKSFDDAAEAATKTQEVFDRANVRPELLTQQEAFFTGYQGTLLPEQQQIQQAQNFFDLYGYGAEQIAELKAQGFSDEIIHQTDSFVGLNEKINLFSIGIDTSKISIDNEIVSLDSNTEALERNNRARERAIELANSNRNNDVDSSFVGPTLRTSQSSITTDI